MFTQPRGSTSLKMGAETVAKVLKISPVEVFTKEIGGVINNHTIIYSHVSSEFLFLPKITNKRFKSLNGYILTFNDNTTLDLKSINIVRKNFRIKYFDNFEDGFTVTSAFDVYQHGVGKYYRYDGDLPFVVAAKTDPEADEKWISVSFGEGSGGGSSDIEITQDLGESTTAVVSQRGITEATASSRELGQTVDKIYPNKNVDWKGTQSIVDTVKGYRMQIGVNDGWNNLGVGYIASQKDGTWSILQIPHETGTRQIASRQWVNTMVRYTVSSSILRNPSGTDRVCMVSNDAGEGGGYDYQNNRWAFVHNQANMTIWGGVTNIANGDYVGYKSQRGDGTSIQWQTSPYNNNTYNSTSFAFYEQDKPSGATNVNQWRFNREGSVDVATRQWIKSASGIAGTTLTWSNADLLYVANGCATFRQGGGTSDNYFSRWGAGVHLNYADTHGMRLFINGANAEVITNVRYSSGEMMWNTLWGSQNTTVDGNGFIKRASPIVTINNSGYTTNAQSRGATVRKLAVGHYQICNILGYNDDGAWGVNGGIVVPKDNNGLELVYVDDRVQKDGSIIIETYHRQHAHLPERFQNWRVKEIGSNGDRVFLY